MSPLPITRALAAALAGALLGATSVAAQRPVPRLTLAELERAALDSNPGLRVASVDVALARADAITAALRPNPQASVVADVLPLGDAARYAPSNNQYSLSLQLPIELGGKRQRRTETAEAYASTAQLLYADSARRVLLAVRLAFYDVQAGEQGLQLASRNVQLYARLTALSRSRFEQKQISGTELSRAALGQTQAELARDAALVQLQRAQDVLAFTVGRRERIAVRDTLAPSTRSIADLATLEAMALRQRPDVLFGRALRAAADANARLQDANATITPSVSVDYVVQQGQQMYGVSGSVPLNLFNRNQGEREKARYRQLQADRTLHGAELAALTDLRSAWTDYEGRRAAVARFSTAGPDGILARAQSVLESTEFAYRSGSLSLLEYLDAVRTFAEIYRSYVDAVAQLNKAISALDAASGADLPQLLDRSRAGAK